MTNVDMKVEGNILTIKVDLSQDHGKSSTGKTTTVATSHGYQEIVHNNTIFKLNLHLLKK